MTEIIIQAIKNKGICVVDNHRGKTGKQYTILVSNLTQEEAYNYMYIKGVL